MTVQVRWIESINSIFRLTTKGRSIIAVMKRMRESPTSFATLMAEQVKPLRRQMKTEDVKTA